MDDIRMEQPKGHGFDPKNPGHRLFFRQQLHNIGNPRAVQAITGLLDYADELERQNTILSETIRQKDAKIMEIAASDPKLPVSETVQED